MVGPWQLRALELGQVGVEAVVPLPEEQAVYGAGSPAPPALALGAHAVGAGRQRFVRTAAYQRIGRSTDELAVRIDTAHALGRLGPEEYAELILAVTPEVA